MLRIPNYQKRGKMLLPCVYIKPNGDIKKSFNEKIKVSVRKLLKSLSERKCVNNACGRADRQ